jgi:hypothetical protein
MANSIQGGHVTLSPAAVLVLRLNNPFGKVDKCFGQFDNYLTQIDNPLGETDKGVGCTRYNHAHRVHVKADVVYVFRAYGDIREVFMGCQWQDLLKKEFLPRLSEGHTKCFVIGIRSYLLLGTSYGPYKRRIRVCL